MEVLPFHVKNRCPVISHLMFADDVLIFLNGRRESIKNMMEFLGEYQAAAGQKLM